MRKIVQIAVGAAEDEDTYVALCNDGTAWVSHSRHDEWKPLKPIPQDEEKEP